MKLYEEIYSLWMNVAAEINTSRSPPFSDSWLKLTFLIRTNWFPHLLLFHTWLRVTRTLHLWSQALCTPLGQRTWRSHHRTLSPTLHCRKLPPGPHSVSSFPQLDAAGLQGWQTLTERCTAPTWTERLTKERGWSLGPAWCKTRQDKKAIWREIIRRKVSEWHCNWLALCKCF